MRPARCLSSTTVREDREKAGLRSIGKLLCRGMGGKCGPRNDNPRRGRVGGIDPELARRVTRQEERRGVSGNRTSQLGERSEDCQPEMLRQHFLDYTDRVSGSRSPLPDFERLIETPPNEHPDRRDEYAEGERQAPSPRHHFRPRQKQMRERGSQRAHRDAQRLRGKIPTREECTGFGRSVFHQKRRARPELPAGRKSLQKPRAH